jgi:hypothetical protein
MPLMRRRPLLRAAAVGTGAYMAGKSRQQATEREQGQEARLEQLEAQQPAQQYAPPPAPAAPTGVSDDAIDRLRQLGELHEQGVLTDDEFAQQKARVLAG